MNPRNRGNHPFDHPKLRNTTSLVSSPGSPSSSSTSTATARSPYPQYNLGIHYLGMSRNICWSPEAFQEKDMEYIHPRRSCSSLTSNTTKAENAESRPRVSSSTLPSSIFGNDLEILSDSTLYSHASLQPKQQQQQSPQQHGHRSDNKQPTTRKALGFLRSNSSSQGESSNSSQQQQSQHLQKDQKDNKPYSVSSRDSDDFLYRHPQPSTITSLHSSTAPTVTAAPSFKSIFSASANHSISDSIAAKKMDDRIVVEDWLQKRSSSLQLVWRRRWCVLKDDCLLYYRSNIDTKPIGVLRLADYALLTSGSELSRKSKLAFRLSLTTGSAGLTDTSIPSSPLTSSAAASMIASTLGPSSTGMATPGNQDKNQQTHHLFHAETQQALDLWLEAIQSHIDHAQAHQQANDRKDVSFGGSKSRADSLDQNNNQHLTYGYRSQHRQQNDRDYHEGLDQGGQSIIDKVLDRLLLEDPTLSDMNDPSTLIMPAQEHPSSVASVRSLQMCVDDNLGAWSTSSSTFLYSRDKNISNDSTRSAIASSANTSMSLESNKFNSSYGVGTGSFSGRSKQQPQSTEESFFAGGSSYSSSLHSHSAASSYVGISDITASLKQNGPSSIPSSQTQEHPGKTTTYQRHRQGHIGAPGGRSQQPLVLQIPGSAMHPRQPDGESPSTSYYSTDSPASSPKLGIISPTSSAFSSTFLTSPEFYVLEVDNLRSDQDGSSASPSQSSSGGSSVVTATANENDSTLIQDDDDRNFTPPSPIYYGASQDLSPMMINEKEAKAKAAMASSPKKVKKLWSVYGSSALKSHPIAQTSKTYEDQIDHGGSNNSKRYMTTTSEALDASNPLLRGLILVDSTQSLKNGSGRSSGSSNSKSGSDGKGSRFSKSMTSLPKKHDDLSSSRDLFSAPAAQSYEHRHLPLPPRTRTGSVSIIDEKLPKPQHQHLRHQPHRQYSSDSIKPQPSIGNILSSVISIPILQIQQQQQSSSASSTTRGSVHTAPIKVASGSWTPKTGADGRPRYQSAQMRCIDPDLVLTPGHRSHSLISPLSSTAAPSSSAGSSRQETTHSNGTEQVHGKNPFVVDVARQIVPTDELVQAIAQETAAEELLKQRRERQELEVVKMSEESKVENSNIESLPTHQIVQEGLAATTTHSDHDDQVQGQDTGAPTIPLRSPYRAAVNATQR